MEKTGPKRLNHKEMGERSEVIIAARLVSVGYIVLKPLGENHRYDLVIEDADRKFWRVQCKTAWISKDQQTIRFNSCSNHYAYTWQKDTMTKRHYRGEVEYFAVYNPDLEKVYFVPVDDVGITQVTLRLTPPKNNQLQKVNMAKDYEL